MTEISNNEFEVFFPYFYVLFLAGGLVVHKLTKSRLCFIVFYFVFKSTINSLRFKLKRGLSWLKIILEMKNVPRNNDLVYIFSGIFLLTIKI